MREEATLSGPAHDESVPGDLHHDPVGHVGSHVIADDGGHEDAHAQEPLGPIDWPVWGMALAGGVLAIVVAVTLVLAAHP